MSEKKNWGSTVLGWFVVKEGEASPIESGDPGAEPAPADPSGGDVPPPVPPVTFSADLPPVQGGQVDFDAVFRAAGIEDSDRDLFGKAASLVTGLPAGADPAVKKQIVEASLKAFGVPVAKIIETGAESIQVLEAYRQKQAADLEKTAEDVRELVEGYEAKIREAKGLLERKAGGQAAAEKRCNDKKLEVQKVLEFFGQEAVARVVRESPKLVDPSAPPDRKD